MLVNTEQKGRNCIARIIFVTSREECIETQMEIVDENWTVRPEIRYPLRKIQNIQSDSTAFSYIFF